MAASCPGAAFCCASVARVKNISRAWTRLARFNAVVVVFDFTWLVTVTLTGWGRPWERWLMVAFVALALYNLAYAVNRRAYWARPGDLDDFLNDPENW